MVEKVTVGIASRVAGRDRWFLLTSLSSGKCGPRGLLEIFRDQWSIENIHHQVKDSSWDEDIHAQRYP